MSAILNLHFDLNNAIFVKASIFRQTQNVIIMLTKIYGIMHSPHLRNIGENYKIWLSAILHRHFYPIYANFVMFDHPIFADSLHQKND